MWFSMNNPEKVFSMVTKHEWGILTVVVLLGIAIRFYGINQPIVESHQVRQAQTAMIARNLYEDHMNIFRTRLDVLGNVPGYIILEFPLMHGITALLYYLFGVHDMIGRLVSVAFSVGAMFLMYGLARQFLSVVGAFGALFLYVFSPMNIFFSRAFMPESSLMFFVTGAVYYFLKWLDKQTFRLYFAAVLFAAGACLTKPTAALIFAPILTAWFIRDKWALFRRFDFWLYMFLAASPLIIWGLYANNFNAKIPYQTFSYGDSWVEVLKARGIVKHWFSAKFYAFVGGSIVFLLLTPLGLLGTLTGTLCVGAGERRKILYSWLGAIILYFFILAGPNSWHIYYQLPLLPVASIFFGFTLEWLLNKSKFIKEIFKRRSLFWITVGIIGIIAAGYGLGYLKFFKYMYSDRTPYVLEVSEIIKKNTPGKRFVLDNESGLLIPVISYHSHSKALPFLVNDSAVQNLENLRALGATTFVAMKTAYGSCVESTKANKAFWNYLNKKYKLLALTDHYFIFDLK